MLIQNWKQPLNQLAILYENGFPRWPTGKIVRLN